MIKLNFNNIFSCQGVSVSESEWRANGAKLTEYISKLKSREQGFYSIIDDFSTEREILAYAKKQKSKFESIVVLGIGGSALGLLAVNQAINNLYYNELKKRKAPKLYVLDNIDPALIRETEEAIDLSKTLFVVISKSGVNVEPIAQYLYFRNKIEQKKLPVKKHFVFITDEKKGHLRAVARDENITAFTIPDNVGGRFSVLTPVGLLPAALVGINISKILAGAREMSKSLFLANFSQNIAFQMANLQYKLFQKGRSINVLMPYSQHLIRLADWYRQLLAESIGKEKNRAGNKVNVGITPVNALGATDQHSQLQLYNEGPQDKLIIFIRLLNASKKLVIPAPPKQLVGISFLQNTSFDELLDLEYQGTAAALTKNCRLNFTIEIDEVNEMTLGELFMFFEGSVAFLGELFNVDAFNQPGVELSKQITKDLLSS